MNVVDLTDTRNRHLARILELQARDNGDTEFLITDDHRITFAQAEQLCLQLATGFADLGVGRGDRVCFFMANLPELVLMCLALNKLGAVWVPVCTDYRGDWLQDAVVRSRAKVLVTDAAHLEHVSPIRENLNCAHMVVIEEDAAAAAAAIPYCRLTDHPPHETDYSEQGYGDTSAILWTSGTTGKSKGVMVAHNNWIRSTLNGTLLQ